MALEDIGANDKTYPTSIIDAASVGNNPTFPKLPLFLLAGTLLGLLFGAALAIYRERKTGRT